MLPLLISLGVVGSATRRIMHWTGKAILWLVVALLVLAVVGAIYQAIATWRAERAHPPPGKMVDVGNHNRLHINCVGQGSPTVVLDAALGTMSASWVRVQREVSGTTRVCAYDRAGMGWSERIGTQGRQSRSQANYTPCSRVPTSGKALTCLWAIRSAACTRRPTPPGILTRLRAWP